MSAGKKGKERSTHIYTNKCVYIGYRKINNLLFRWKGVCFDDVVIPPWYNTYRLMYNKHIAFEFYTIRTPK